MTNEAQQRLPTRHEVDFGKLRAANVESAYVEEAVELLKETASWLTLGLSITEKSKRHVLERDQAICAGQLVRMYKICALSVLQFSAGHGGDHQMALAREFVESAGAAAYLLEKIDTKERFNAYIYDSLIPERELLRTIKQQVRERNGVRLPIEERMERSVQATLKTAGVELEEIPPRKQNNWPSVESRLKLLGPVAYNAYRAGSSAVHGTWTDLARNHLEETDGGFIPQLAATAIRPQPLLMMSFLGCRTLEQYLRNYVSSAAEFLVPHIRDLGERVSELDSAHELFLNED